MKVYPQDRTLSLNVISFRRGMTVLSLNSGELTQQNHGTPKSEVDSSRSHYDSPVSVSSPRLHLLSVLFSLSLTVNEKVLKKVDYLLLEFPFYISPFYLLS